MGVSARADPGMGIAPLMGKPILPETAGEVNEIFIIYMSKNKFRSESLRVLALLMFPPLLLAACGSGSPATPNTTMAQPGVTSASGSSSTSFASGSLTLTPQNPTVAPGGTITFSTTGGTAPYYYYVTSGNGTMSGSTYTAPSSDEVDQVTVADSSGLAAMTSVDVTTSATSSSSSSSSSTGGTLQISPLNPSVAPGGSVTFTVTGGTPPYFYFVTSGSGTFNGNTYTAPSTTETDQIAITDSSGLSATTTVTVGAGSSSSSSSSFTSSGGGSEVPVYRFYMPSTGEHFFTLDSSEGTAAGFTSEGIGFNVYSGDWTSGLELLYRCYYNSKHFISIDPNCEGATAESTYGYIFTGQAANTTPLYRFYLPATGDHLETTNFSEGAAAGYHLDGILGYVPTS